MRVGIGGDEREGVGCYDVGCHESGKVAGEDVKVAPRAPLARISRLSRSADLWVLLIEGGSGLTARVPWARRGGRVESAALRVSVEAEG